jgi:hypothetical protein
VNSIECGGMLTKSRCLLLTPGIRKFCKWEIRHWHRQKGIQLTAPRHPPKWVLPLINKPVQKVIFRRPIDIYRRSISPLSQAPSTLKRVSLFLRSFLFIKQKSTLGVLNRLRRFSRASISYTISVEMLKTESPKGLFSPGSGELSTRPSRPPSSDCPPKTSAGMK